MLSVAAIWIAIKSSRNTSKDATKQIESIKELAKIQISTSIKQMEVEIKKNILLARQAKEELNKVREINNSPLSNQVDWRNEMLRKRKAFSGRYVRKQAAAGAAVCFRGSTPPEAFCLPWSTGNKGLQTPEIYYIIEQLKNGRNPDASGAGFPFEIKRYR